MVGFENFLVLNSVRNKKIPPYIFFIFFSFLLLMFFHKYGIVKANPDSWWNTSFQYKRLITVTNPQPNWQMWMNLTYNTHYKNSDCSDIRFTNSSENEEYDYWVEQYSSSAWCSVWVEMRQSGNFYLYYKNTTVVSSSSNGTNTFDSFEDCNDVSDWTVNSPNELSSSTDSMINGNSCFSHTHGTTLSTKTYTNTSNMYIHFKIKANSTGWGGFGYGCNDGGGDKCFRAIDWGTTRLSSYYDGAEKPIINPTINGQWYKCRYHMNNTQAGTIWCGVANWNWTNLNYTLAEKPNAADNDYNTLAFMGAGLSWEYLDDIFVTKSNYPSAEPTYSIGAEEKEIPEIIIKQWLETPWYNGTHINFTVNVWVYNNDTSTISDTIYVNFTSLNFTNYTIPSLNVGAWNLTSETKLFIRPTVDSWFNQSAVKMFGGANGTSNTLKMILPIDPVFKEGIDASFNISMPSSYSWTKVTGTDEGEATTIAWVSFNFTDIPQNNVQPYTQGSSSNNQNGSLKPILYIKPTGNTNINISLKVDSTKSGVTVYGNASCSGTYASCQTTKQEIGTDYVTLVNGSSQTNSYVNITLYADLQSGTSPDPSGFVMYIKGED